LKNKPYQIRVVKYNPTAIKIDFVHWNQTSFGTTVSFNLIKGLDPIYILFVSRIAGAVTTDDKKNTNYKFRKKAFQDAH